MTRAEYYKNEWDNGDAAYTDLLMRANRESVEREYDQREKKTTILFSDATMIIIDRPHDMLTIK